MHDENKQKPLCGSCGEPRGKLQATDWLEGLGLADGEMPVEVIFKNTRVGFYANPSGIPLKIGDIVAVEASPGHDIGRVAMTGPLVARQMKKFGVKAEPDMKKIFRIARQAEIDRFEEVRAREHDTMIRSRRIAEELGLNMKIGDVEYQGDGGKAIFYYIADERVDFRRLIRILADTFKVRIEMRQIGARQEAARIGGIGPCGRPLCCSRWMTHFVSVGTGAARLQDLSMNPQKLAGQCAKLKCCINFEVDAYGEAHKQLPPKDMTLETKDATYYYFKPDILARTVTYSTDRNIPANLVTVPAERAFEIIALNKQGIKVDSLLEQEKSQLPPKEYVDLVGQDSLTRFDKTKKKKKKKKKPQAETTESKPAPDKAGGERNADKGVVRAENGRRQPKPKAKAHQPQENQTERNQAAGQPRHKNRRHRPGDRPRQKPE